ncbi:MAG: glycerophosphodiester phosphodiesterase [Actinomycetota bacterium]
MRETSRSGPALYGHRGGERGPENSLAAVRGAIDVGADGVEIDIRISPEGVAVTGHDPFDSDRTTDAEGAPVTLRELLAVIEDAGIDLLIDFKSDGAPDREAAVVAETLAAGRRPELVLVSSFSIPFLEQLGRLTTNHPLIPIVSLRQNFPWPGRFDRWDGVSVLAAAMAVNPLLAFRLHRRGGRLLVWFGFTAWSPVIRAAVALGAEALIVAEVDRTFEILSSRR